MTGGLSFEDRDWSRFILRFIFCGFVLLLWFARCTTPANQLEPARGSLKASYYLPDSYRYADSLYRSYCASCHGEEIAAFADRRWLMGSSREALRVSIVQGNDTTGMPAFHATFDSAEVGLLVDYIQWGMDRKNKYHFKGGFAPQVFQAEKFDYRLDTIASGFEVAWGLEFLPDGRFLLTERSGTLYLIDSRGDKSVVDGSPRVVTGKYAGLLDIVLHPQFESNQWLYYSYAKLKISGAGDTLTTLAVQRARLQKDQLSAQEDIFIAQPFLPVKTHFGARMLFDEDGYLYIVVGDRDELDKGPQTLNNHLGKIHRITDDGSIPADNPFVNETGAVSTIYSWGHRNPQGLTLHPKTAEIWSHEHGPKGGDEINLIRAGVNFGWPEISYGIDYDGSLITPLTHKKNMAQPLHYWVPSIAPSGMAFVTGTRYPGWEGSLLIGSLRFRYMERCELEGQEVVNEEALFKKMGRVRTIKMGPDGYIYFTTEFPGALYKIVPIAKQTTHS